MWLFLASECMLFGALISTYVLYRGRSREGPFPADVFDIPFTSVSSFVLLASSVTMVLALSAAQQRDAGRMRLWLLTTALLGVFAVILGTGVGAGLATVGALAGYAMGGRGVRGVNRAFSNAVFAMVAARPLGRFIQSRYTTSGDVKDMSVRSITPFKFGNLTVHWVATEFHR
jgi:hypothetical protein